MIRILAIAVALLGLASVAQADVWRWTDPNGTVHYSDNWVRGSVLVKTDSQSSYSPAPESNENTSSTPPADGDAAQSERDKRTVASDVAKTQAEQCKKARETYEKAITSRRIYKAGADGSREFLSDADADAYRLQLLNARKQACGS